MSSSSHPQPPEDNATGQDSPLDEPHGSGMFHALVAHAPDGIALVQTDRSISYANHVFAKLLGYDDPEECTGISFDTLCADDGAQFVHIYDYAVSHATWEGLLTCRRQDGSILRAQVSACALLNTAGILDGVGLFIHAHLPATASISQATPTPTDQFDVLRQRAEQMLSAPSEQGAAQEATDILALLHEMNVAYVELELQNQELSRTRQELQAALDLYHAVPVGYLTLDADGFIQTANHAAATLLHVAPAHLFKHRLEQFIIPEDRDHYFLYRKQAWQQHELLTCDVRIRRNDESLFYAHLEGVAEPEGQHTPALQRMIITDISGQRQAEEALRQSEERFRIAAELSSDAIYEANLETRETRVFSMRNFPDIARQMFTRATLDIWEQALHPEDRERVLAALDRLIEFDEPYAQEYRFIVGDELLYLSERATVLRDHTGKAYQLVGANANITEHKQAEAALRQSQERYRALVEHSGFAITMYDSDGVVLLYNEMASHLLGGEPRDLVGKSLHDLFPPDLADSYVRRIRHVVGQNQPEWQEDEIQTAAGVRWYWTGISPLCDTRGQPYAVQVVAHDITERKLAEAALRQSQERYRRAVEAGRVNVWDWNLQTDEITISDTLSQLLGYEDEGPWTNYEDWARHVLPEDLQDKWALFEASLQSGIPQHVVEYRIKHRDGSIHWFLTRYSVIRDEQDTPLRVIGTDTEITDLKQTQLALHQRLQELEALRATMNDISSELNLDTLLRAIVERAMALLGTRCAELGLYDTYFNDIHIQVSQGFDQDYRGTRLALGEGVMGMVAQMHQPLIISNYNTWEDRSAHYEAVHPHTVLAVPMLMGEHLVGVISVGDENLDRVFTFDDMQLLHLFAQHATIAIRNARLYGDMHSLAMTDSLTGLYTRRQFFELANLELEQVQRYGGTLSIIMVDIDNFKRVNDTHGHALGDQALQTVATHAQAELRTVDVIGRYGGEEIVILLASTDLQGAWQVAERLRQVLEKANIPNGNGTLRVTVSLGIASYDSDENPDLDTLIDRADQALRQAKQAGKNRVAVWSRHRSLPHG